MKLYKVIFFLFFIKPEHSARTILGACQSTSTNAVIYGVRKQYNYIGHLDHRKERT